MTEITLNRIINEFHAAGVISECQGDPETRVRGIAAVEDCGPGDLVFVDKKEYIALVQERRPAAAVTSLALKNFLAETTLPLLIAPNVALAHALIKGRYAARDFDKSGWPGRVHASAVVHETARVDSTCVVEPNAVIGARVTIGKNTRIMAGVVVENDAVIGDNTIVQPLALVGHGCRIGNEVNIGGGSVIGSEGYGFAQDEKRKSYPIPQTGIVVIEDRVRLGANCCIDRAAYKVTRIGAGTKLDNLCHVAHNVDIGSDCLLTSMLCIAGSSKVGDRVITSGQTGILDHVSVGSDTVFLHRAGVAKDVTEPGAYAGYPLLPLNQYMRNMAVFKNLEDLKKRVADLEKQLK